MSGAKILAVVTYSQPLIRPLLSFEILLLLGAILFASWLTFSILVRRWTTQRHRVAMAEWGRRRGFRLDMAADVRGMGPPLDVLGKYSPQSGVCLDDGRTRIIAVVADPPPSVGWAQSEGPPESSAEAGSVLEYQSPRRHTGQIPWGVLLRRGATP